MFSLFPEAGRRFLRRPFFVCVRKRRAFDWRKRPGTGRAKARLSPARKILRKSVDGMVVEKTAGENAEEVKGRRISSRICGKTGGMV